ncbi:P-loop containing nucleoside triphosphate hydrolase protein [Dissoconium aciculare CBS 342.82]|uniref:P-loop containing nucleoside triphosphate hydrolase protein n=1 Tax=Dissoconium aciculare CBS 342.82 TaxID=1314786 RepID=A0A6J3M4W4_9PEZI|nr:P-loop containing nucleoside triphosphate hydrolase protein [Dissoconium aciculare CBS 342.82]KAF1821942.1 P-loop containing nucleoside triphosphate hydrolase protein [Dissoconium aciculare CBS 342.82]
MAATQPKITEDAAEDSDNTQYSSDSDDADYEPSSLILSTYRKLISRRVDLVGDYAGSETFLIDGDSILLDCFTDELLDFGSGCQLLHAAYNVEHFLHSLVQRKCIFKIVFFDSNKKLCIPPSAKTPDAPKYLLARAAIIRHLSINLPAVHPEIAIHRFPSWRSAEFRGYLQDTSPYFVMAHDGALAEDSGSATTAEDSDNENARKQQLSLREMILFFIDQGFNVSLINGIELRDTKVMTTVQEIRNRAAFQSLNFEEGEDVEEDESNIDSDDIIADLQKLKGDSLTERHILGTLTIAHIVRHFQEKKSEGPWQKFSAKFLLHQALLTHVPLSARRFDAPVQDASASGFLNIITLTAGQILDEAFSPAGARKCDVIDFVDGRLFLQTCTHINQVDASVQETLNALANAVKILTGVDLAASLAEASEGKGHNPENVEASSDEQRVVVLPFSNSILDKHLESVRIKLDNDAAGEQSISSRKIFREVTHWHNAKKPIIVKGPVTPADERKAKKEAKRNQLFMAEMRTYAASLTNAVGKSLSPETIIVGETRSTAPSKSSNATPVDSDASDANASKAKPGQKKGGGGKTAQKNAGKQAMLKEIAATKAKKDESASDKIVGAWQVVCRGFEADRDPRSRYAKAKAYLTTIQDAWRAVVGAEVELYMVSCLVQYWINVCAEKEQKQRRLQVTALTWSHLRSIGQQPPLQKSITRCIDLTVKTLGLPPVPEAAEAPVDRKLAFTFALPTTVKDLSIGLPSKDFQLLECGPYLERSFDSKPDHRVDFKPDGWQRQVLDSIDADKSVFVVAPTSAGKTFISFYAMQKVLEADDDGVLVFVAPTKALVNQIAAEVQARFTKNFKYGGKSVWAIHTRDYRINNPTGCQVLVTVPHVLQILLLSGTHANSWSNRVKRIIFDEIHSIGSAEDGVVWEQLLLMAPCPIVALSATVGNPDEFSGWLSSTQASIGKELVSVRHPHRYSDLRKYYYVKPKVFDFQGIPEKSAFGSLGLEGLPGFRYIHPVAALVDKSRGIPEDLALEPRDCLLLWQAMTKVRTEKYPVAASLDPAKALPPVSRKVDILKWEAELKKLLRTWLESADSPYSNLLKDLEVSFRDTKAEEKYSTALAGNASAQQSSSSDGEDDLSTSTLPLLCRLHEQDALPAILFNYDRHMCEKICKSVLEQLEAAELKQRKTGDKWQKTLVAFEEWKKLKEKNKTKMAKETSKKSAKAAKSKDDDGDADRTSKLDLQRDAFSSDDTKWESFDPEGPLEGYHFADLAKAQRSDLEVYVRQLRFKDVPEYLIKALGRGIGVHHAGMNRKYRQIVEILFRKGFLRVIIATGTLALGINMPCKTVVFSGDSVFLTALNFRQAAGRAGRRGFDLLGNVVFQGISRQKVCKLISSRLPDLSGHFPITTTLVLRLFSLLFDSKQSKYAISAINSLLSQPRLYMGGPSFKDQTMHHLRFSIEYLRQQQLLGYDGQPLNFAGLVSHLYFTENSSFAFHALLKEGYFHELCAGINGNEKNTLETLMLIMAHLFKRRVLRQADLEHRNDMVIKPSSSIVFLPPMPTAASKILIDHNKQTLRVYKAYVETFVEQNITEADDVLPFSKMKAGGTGQPTELSLGSLPPTRLRSSFVALSGAGDDFASIHDMCSTVRDGVFLEEAVVPHMSVYPEEMSVPLNAWLLDFYKHGDVHTIERANGVRRADIWFELNDFSLILATIIASLMSFMKLTDASDLDMLEVLGNMDAHEEAEDDKFAANEDTASLTSDPASLDSGVAFPDRTGKTSASTGRVPTKKQAKNADSWEDLEDDLLDSDVRATAQKALGGAAEDAELQGHDAAWDEEGGEGLKLVLKAFKRLHEEFTVKFKAMWA